MTQETRHWPCFPSTIPLSAGLGLIPEPEAPNAQIIPPDQFRESWKVSYFGLQEPPSLAQCDWHRRILASWPPRRLELRCAASFPYKEAGPASHWVLEKSQLADWTGSTMIYCDLMENSVTQSLPTKTYLKPQVKCWVEPTGAYWKWSKWSQDHLNCVVLVTTVQNWFSSGWHNTVSMMWNQPQPDGASEFIFNQFELVKTTLVQTSSSKENLRTPASQILVLS